MRFSMDLRTGFVALFVLLGVATSRGDGSSYDPHYLSGDYIPPPEYYSQDWSPELNYAYTEVSTPFYHYYFYAPAVKSPSFEDPRTVPTGQGGYIPPYRTMKFPEDTFYPSQGRNYFPAQSSRDEYYSPQFNDVRYPTHEISTHRPKFHKQYFLERPYSDTFNSEGLPRAPQKPFDLTSSLLPTVLSSSTPNIIRKEDNGRAIHDNLFRSYSYAPSFKDHTPHHTFKPNPSSYKPTLNRSLFSSAAPNIIRDEVSSINKLFKPVPKANTNDPLSFQTPSYPFTSQTAVRGANQFNPHTSISSSVSPAIISSTHPPLSFRTSEIPDYSIEETLSPLFTSSQTPLEYFTASTPLNAQSPSLNLGAVSSESPRVLFEAPGHTQPRRR